MKLSDLNVGEEAVIVRVECNGDVRKRIMEMGFVKGKKVSVVKKAPLQDPIEYEIMGYDVSLRRSEAATIEVSQIKEQETKDTKGDKETKDINTKNINTKDINNTKVAKADTPEHLTNIRSSEHHDNQSNKSNNTITVAFIGNPNCGKTSLFNFICGLREHVGNYSGVTVNSKEASVQFQNYTIKITDLPGTYSMSSYSPEELYVRNYISDTHPDIIVNIIDGSNIERNLYLTTQLLDLNLDMVVALNMYDELQNSGSKFDYKAMGELLGAQFIPTIGKRGSGIAKLLQAVVNRYESTSTRAVNINYGELIEREIDTVSASIKGKNTTNFQDRYVALKLIEGDISLGDNFSDISVIDLVATSIKKIEREYGEQCETVIADVRYGFISGALKETYKPITNAKKLSKQIDAVVTNKILGFPIFLFVMWFMFYCTFTLGEYPTMLIEWLIGKITDLSIAYIPSGALQDFIIDGIIGGVGGVIVFLPNILLLFLFISFLEDSGYMSRAAFIMDKFMHRIGLHGKSFIPLIMGFGCNVPAIMATRIIEDKNNRILTMLILPFMSCSARLPVYLLIVTAFFPNNGSSVLFAVYIIGIIIAIVTSIIFKKVLFNKKDTPFVMELPPYRMPTAISILKHMWQKGSQYIQKMGGIILVAVVIVWTLSYYPKRENIEVKYQNEIENVISDYNLNITNGVSKKEALITKDSTLAVIETKIGFEHSKSSYLGRVGQFIEPVFKPLGFDWKISVGLLSGIAAKEIVVSTLGVLYNAEDGADGLEHSLGEKLRLERKENGEPVFNKAVAFSFLMFILIYFPCVAVIVAIQKEGGTKWALFSMVYTTALAWVISFVIYQIFG